MSKITMTDAQREQLLTMYAEDNQGYRSFDGFLGQVQPELGHDAVLIVWKGMTVGIEPDGYRHT